MKFSVCIAYCKEHVNKPVRKQLSNAIIFFAYNPADVLNYPFDLVYIHALMRYIKMNKNTR
jgi:hypothetical protein